MLLAEVNDRVKVLKLIDYVMEHAPDGYEMTQDRLGDKILIVLLDKQGNRSCAFYPLIDGYVAYRYVDNWQAVGSSTWFLPYERTKISHVIAATELSNKLVKQLGANNVGLKPKVVPQFDEKFKFTLTARSNDHLTAVNVDIVDRGKDVGYKIQRVLSSTWNVDKQPSITTKFQDKAVQVVIAQLKRHDVK